MKTFFTVLVCLAVLAGFAFAAGIDGKWQSERKVNRNGEEMTITQTFDLKSAGGKITGTITMKFGDMEPRQAEIKEGTIDGNKFSFKAVTQGPNGEVTTTWEGTVAGSPVPSLG